MVKKSLMTVEKNGKNAVNSQVNLQSIKRCSRFITKNVLSLPGVPSILNL